MDSNQSKQSTESNMDSKQPDIFIKKEKYNLGITAIFALIGKTDLSPFNMSALHNYGNPLDKISPNTKALIMVLSTLPSKPIFTSVI